MQTQSRDENSVQERLHNGGNGARCTMVKIGEGNFVMIMMLLLVSIIIYYCMNTLLLYTSALLNMLI